MRTAEKCRREHPWGTRKRKTDEKCFQNLTLIPILGPDWGQGKLLPLLHLTISTSAQFDSHTLASLDWFFLCLRGPVPLHSYLSWFPVFLRLGEMFAKLGGKLLSATWDVVALFPMSACSSLCPFPFLLSHQRPLNWERGVFLGQHGTGWGQAAGKEHHFVDTDFTGRPRGLQSGDHLIFYNSPLLKRWQERGKNQSAWALAPGAIICLLLSAFSYLSLKSRGRKQSATDVLMDPHGAWIQLACKLSS